MTPDPTLTDEELARIEAAMLSPHVSYAHFTTTMAPRLIAALRASQKEVEHHEHQWADLECRLREADAKLQGMASDGPEPARLRSKAEGVRLALSYLREYVDTPLAPPTLT